jgi:hypothetical protein
MLIRSVLISICVIPAISGTALADVAIEPTRPVVESGGGQWPVALIVAVGVIVAAVIIFLVLRLKKK